MRTNRPVTRSFSFALALLIISLCLMTLAVARAQSGQQDPAIQTLRFDQPAKGQISNDAFRQVYSFSGRSTDVITLSVTVNTGNLVPMLILTDGQGILLSRDVSASSATISALALPADGTYFVIVSRFGQDQGTTTGSYTLLMKRVALNATPTPIASPGQRPNAPTLTLLHYGDSLVGTIDTQAEQPYVFTAQRGDLISITMQRISGDLDAYLILADAQGHPLVTNDDDPASPGTLDAAIRRWLIHTSGDYQIVATRFGRASGPSRGAYSLTLDRVPPEQLGVTLDLAALLDYGGSSTGAISPDALVRYYQFEAHKGDVIAIDVERTIGNLDPAVTLYDATQNQIQLPVAGLRGQSALIRDYVISADATYFVYVSRYFGDKGFTAGSFSIELTGWQGSGLTVETSPNTGNPLLRLIYGSAITSTLDAGNPSVTYYFSGKKGDTITVDMAALTGDLQSALILLDGHGQLLTQTDPGTADAQINGYILPATDVYSLVVGRHSRVNGTTSGSYHLTLTGTGR
jgi:hypothetical protein